MFTTEEIQTIVSHAFPGETGVEIIDDNMKTHSNVKIGFFGDHQNLVLTLKRNNNAKPEQHSFFVKALPRSSTDQSTFVRDHGLFDQESAFFNVMQPLLESSSKKAQKWCPKCYLANDRVVVLEDMRQSGYAMSDTKFFEREYLEAAVRAQARLHASSLLAEAKIGESLKEICPQACTEVVFIEKQIEHKRVELYTDLAEKVAERMLKRDHGKLKVAMQRGFDRIHKPTSKIGMVVSHGDTWPNNYLHNSDATSSVMVDFQLCRYAPRMYDVAQLVYLSTTREMRRRDEKAVIKAYHEELCETLKRNNPALPRPSLQEVEEEYEDVRLSALMAGVMYYPIICLSSQELATHKDNEEEIYKRTMFRTDNDYVMELCEREKEYGDRLADVVNEMLDYCEVAELMANVVERCKIVNGGES